MDQHTTAYSFPDTSEVTAFDITYGALEEASLSVPAGTFPCIGVGQVLFRDVARECRLRRPRAELDGRQVAATRSADENNVTDWYSPGIGEVKYIANHTFQLTGYGSTTPAQAISIGQLKAKYATPARGGASSCRSAPGGRGTTGARPRAHCPSPLARVSSSMPARVGRVDLALERGEPLFGPARPPRRASL